MSHNILLTSENASCFFEAHDKVIKAVLFTKKMDTPSLWLRVAEAYAVRCDFGEVRLAEQALMKQFGFTPEVLPKIVAVRTGSDGAQQNILYEGPNDFEKICDFLRDAAEGGRELVDLKRQVDELTREARGLLAELMQEREATKAARAEAARLKLSQVGQVESVRKNLETELQQARASELAVKAQLEGELEEVTQQMQTIQNEHAALLKEVEILKGMQGESASTAMLIEPQTIDTFLENTSRPLKAVLITKKDEIPELWQQLADVHATLCSFGMVRHVHESILQTFSVRQEALPRILLFSSRAAPPLVYEGELTLENISTFIQDAVAGGSACVQLRKKLLAAQGEAEGLRRELADSKVAVQVQRDQGELARREQVGALEATVKSLQTQLKAACAGASAELLQVRGEAEARVQAVEGMAADMSAELLRERQATQEKIREAVAGKEAQVRSLRERVEEAAGAHEVMERELKMAEKAARACERAVLKAASTVHVALVRSARENERNQAALREFIDDIAPSQVEGPMLDARLLREMVKGEDGAGVVDKMTETMSSLSNQYKLLKQRLKISDSSSDDVYVGDGGGASDGSGLVKGQMRRALQFMSRGKSGSDGGGLDSRGPGGVYASQSDGTQHGGEGSGSGSVVHGKMAGARRQGEGGGSDKVGARQGGGGGSDKGGAMGVDAATWNKLKRRQTKDLVSLRGYSDITIGQLTREVHKTRIKNVFVWKDLRLRLLFDGALRDRLIDEETGDLVYAYPRMIEEERLRRKSELDDGEGGVDDQSQQQQAEVASGGRGGRGSGLSDPSYGFTGAGASGDGTGNENSGKGRRGSTDDWSGVASRQGGLGGGSSAVQSRGGKEAAGSNLGEFGTGGARSLDDGRRINRETAGAAAARMPALVGGVLVLASAGERGGRTSDGGLGAALSDGGWHSCAQDGAKEGKGVGAERNGLHSEEDQSNDDLGAWGVLSKGRGEGAKLMPPSVAVPSIWSDDDDSSLGGGRANSDLSSADGMHRQGLFNGAEGVGRGRSDSKASRDAGMEGVRKGHGESESKGSASAGRSHAKHGQGAGERDRKSGGSPAELLLTNIVAKEIAGDAVDAHEDGSGAIPTARGAFSLSAIQARADGREDASARTRLLLMDHNAPDINESRSLWSRLF